MAIDDEHPQYKANKIKWEKMRDCVAGEEQIHDKGDKYLPRLADQTNSEYKAYVKRAGFYNATSRTLDGLSGMVFRKAPEFTYPAGMEEMTEDITLDGMSVVGMAEKLIDDDIAIGRAGILVDHPIVAEGTSVAQAEAANQRPFLKIYDGENIFNWKVENRNNAQTLVQLRLWEMYEVEGDDEFDITYEKQIRVLDLNDVGQYRARVFRKKEIGDKSSSVKDEWVQHGEEVIPKKNGAPLDIIPFFFVGVKNGNAEVEKPPLIDLANVNLSHYRSSADVEHGSHFTGLPTVVVTGHTEDDGEQASDWRIGSANAWIFPSGETEVKYLEFEGKGLDSLETRLEKKEQQMAFLGARMLMPEKAGVEATDTVQIKHSGETSVLASLVISASKSIEDALKFLAEWAGINGDISFKLNTDFLAVSMDAPQLIALLQSWQSGAIAYADLLENLKKGEIVREERTEEDIRSEIETSNPFDDEDFEDA